ncbi:hypothetical protein TIFTF001_015488 [Ficus carica]|uniref:Retrotransposon gag domain-containing protein n=1 Tax=Ficus carica TaxID=3494 RepID=A0AA88A4K5_FICCA|nr:hypothetical protein TIFTF001_015488 [Ficus carica]
MPPRRRMAQNQDIDLAVQLNEIRQMMLAQQQEIGGLRAQLAQQNQGPPDVGVPPSPVNQPTAPEFPNADPVIPENPIAHERMKVPEYEGSTNPIEADNWLVDLQVILNFLRLNDQEKVLCASFMLRKDACLWWETVQIRWDVSKMNCKDFVAEAVKNFKHLTHLCPYLIRSERDKVRRMMRMFDSDLTIVIWSGPHPPTTVAEYVSRAI